MKCENGFFNYCLTNFVETSTPSYIWAQFSLSRISLSLSNHLPPISNIFTEWKDDQVFSGRRLPAEMLRLITTSAPITPSRNRYNTVKNDLLFLAFVLFHIFLQHISNGLYFQSIIEPVTYTQSFREPSSDRSSLTSPSPGLKPPSSQSGGRDASIRPSDLLLKCLNNFSMNRLHIM